MSVPVFCHSWGMWPLHTTWGTLQRGFYIDSNTFLSGYIQKVVEERRTNNVSPQTPSKGEESPAQPRSSRASVQPGTGECDCRALGNKSEEKNLNPSEVYELYYVCSVQEMHLCTNQGSTGSSSDREMNLTRGNRLWVPSLFPDGTNPRHTSAQGLLSDTAVTQTKPPACVWGGSADPLSSK